jgi:hypothetical protein
VTSKPPDAAELAVDLLAAAGCPTKVIGAAGTIATAMGMRPVSERDQRKVNERVQTLMRLARSWGVELGRSAEVAVPVAMTMLTAAALVLQVGVPAAEKPLASREVYAALADAMWKVVEEAMADG